jgi:hypothetical protein
MWPASGKVMISLRSRAYFFLLPEVMLAELSRAKAREGATNFLRFWSSYGETMVCAIANTTSTV